MSHGLAVTWDNPDIVLFENGAPVSSSDLAPDTDYEVRARVWNGSTEGYAVNLPVIFSYLSFGIGTQSHPIGEQTVDLPVKGAPGCPAIASITWHTPIISGHYCLQVWLNWDDDANPENNLGQENTNVGMAQSPAVFEFPVENRDKYAKDVTLEVDAYTPPAPLDCSDVINGRLVPTRRDGKQPTRQEICQELAKRHEQGRFPVPDGWDVDVQPSRFTLGAEGSQVVVVVISPPATFSSGTQAFNVNALEVQNHSLGGVTLYVKR